MIDLDKSRAARAEAKGSGPVVKLGGAEYQLAPEMPFGVLEAMRHLGEGADDSKAPGALADLAKALLGEHYEAVVASGLSVDDLNELIGGVMEEYGVDNAPLASSAS